MERIQQFFATHPEWAGVLFIIVGVVLFLACIFDWHWLFGEINSNNYSFSKIDGLVNFFGRKTARIVCAVVAMVAIISGIVWIWIYIK